MPNAVPHRVAMTGLIALSLLNLLNYLDRNLISALIEPLKHEFGVSDLSIGLVGTVFLVIYTIAAPLFGSLGDRGIRTRVLAAGAVIWSVATSLSGFAQNFLMLLLARGAIGVGEAAYVTVSASLLADYFPRERRGRAFAVFYLAIPVGSALGFIVGGLMEKHFGWRSAFFIAGIPGLLLALWVLALKEPKRGIQDQDQPPPPSAPAEKLLARFKRFFSIRQYRLTVAGYTAYTFAVGGLTLWMPAFLERVRDLPRDRATVWFGIVTVVTGLIGTFVGGWLADRLLKRYGQNAYCWVSAISVAAAIPFAVVALTAPTPMLYFPALAVAQFLIFISTSPINTAIVSFVAPEDRASAMALNVFVIHALGDVISPPLIGLVSDHSSLAQGVLLVPIALVACAVFWWRSARVPLTSLAR
jgi:MFS family permease